MYLKIMLEFLAVALLSMLIPGQTSLLEQCLFSLYEQAHAAPGFPVRMMISDRPGAGRIKPLYDDLHARTGETNMHESETIEPQGSARDFDFLHGNWNVRNRMLNGRLQGSNEWREFPATLVVRPILNGLGNVDEYKATIGGTYLEGITLRLFNPKTKQWSLYWVDNLTMELQVPLIGGFKNGKGEFFADDTYQGQKVRARFIWSEITRDSARWEQAYSTDGGKTWEVNWVMTFTRGK